MEEAQPLVEVQPVVKAQPVSEARPVPAVQSRIHPTLPFIKPEDRSISLSIPSGSQTPVRNVVQQDSGVQLIVGNPRPKRNLLVDEQRYRVFHFKMIYATCFI